MTTKNKRTKKMTENDEALIKKLGALMRKEADASQVLKDISEECANIRNSLAASLKEGSYQAGSWVCNVKDAFRKGAERPAWKTVSTTVEKGIDLIKFELVQRFPDSTSALNKMGKKLHKLYDDTLVANTNVGEDSMNITINVGKLKKVKKTT